MPPKKLLTDDERKERRRVASREHQRRWREQDRVGYNAYIKEQRNKRREKYNATMRAWRANNLEHCRRKEQEQYSAKRDEPEQIIRSMLQQAKYRAKKDGREFNLTPGDIILPTHCPIYGTTFTPPSCGPRIPTAYSLDRIDSSKGYVRGNVAVISWRANANKRNLTVAEVEALLAYMKQGT